MKRDEDTADIDANIDEDSGSDITDADKELEDESLKSSFYIKKRPLMRSNANKLSNKSCNSKSTPIS